MTKIQLKNHSYKTAVKMMNLHQKNYARSQVCYGARVNAVDSAVRIINASKSHILEFLMSDVRSKRLILDIFDFRVVIFFFFNNRL